MASSARTWLLASALLAAGPLPLFAQTDLQGERFTPRVEAKPPGRDDLDRREALTCYALGLRLQASDRLLDALHALEKARRLDPDSAAIHKALVPIYLAFDRDDDALDSCRKALDLDPGDGDTWYLYARRLKQMERAAEARAAYERTLNCPALKDHPELRLAVYLDLADLNQGGKEYAQAAKALQQAAALLEQPGALIEQGALDREEVGSQAADIYERQGRMWVEVKDWPQAEAAFQKAQEKDPTRKNRLGFNLSAVYLAQDDFRKALAALDGYLLTQPEGLEGYERLIAALKRAGRGQEIVPALERYAGVDANNLNLQVLLARQLVEANQIGRADKLYEKLTRVLPTPEVYRDWFGLDLRLERQGQKGAERALERLDDVLSRAKGKDGQAKDAEAAAQARGMLAGLRDQPELVKALLPVVKQRLRGPGLSYATRSFLAELAGRARQLDEAEELYRSCLREGGPGLRGHEGELYAGLLRVLWRGHKQDAIVEVCRQGLTQAQATNRVLFHTNLAQALAALGKGEEAAREADNAVNFSGDEERFYCRRTRALVLAESGRYDVAVAECEGMLKDYTETSDVHDARALLATVYSLAKNYAKAEEQLQLILEANPDDATANNDLGYQWAEQGKKLDEAEQLVRKALALDRKQRTSGTALGMDSDLENAAYVDSLGWVLFREGKLDAARKELERAISLPDGEDDPTVWDHLGDVCSRQNDRTRMGIAWRKALELYEKGHRRPYDDRTKDIKQKLKLLGLTSQQP